MAARQRLAKELKEAARNTDGGIQLLPDETNLLSWRALLQGPPDSPYAGGEFELVIAVPEQYPLVAPAVRFRTKIFHPNIHWKPMGEICLHIPTSTGEICLDILKSAWSPAWTLLSVCQAVVALMSDSAPDSPLNCDAGNLLRGGDLRGYNSLARMYTLELAQPRKR